MIGENCNDMIKDINIYIYVYIYVCVCIQLLTNTIGMMRFACYTRVHQIGNIRTVFVCVSARWIFTSQYLWKSEVSRNSIGEFSQVNISDEVFSGIIIALLLMYDLL